MRDLWLLAASTIDVDVPRARELADQAFAASGPDRYETLLDWLGVRFCVCDELPRGWVYYATDGRWVHQLLLHSDAKAFLLDTPGRRVFVDAAMVVGPGLMPMAPLLMTMLMSTLTPPDSVAGLVDGDSTAT